MKVLWITNIVFPEAEALLKGDGELRSTGGWLVGAAEELTGRKGIELSVASISYDVKGLTVLKGKKITYYLLPTRKFPKLSHHTRGGFFDRFWPEVRQAVQPDVVHIHGTEFSHGLSYVNCCGAENVVVSIQGMTSVYSQYYNCGLKKSDIILSTTLRDMLKGNMLHEQKEFSRRGKYERELISKIRHIIGRTSWDRANTWAINPDAKYHFCNETLRSAFYSGKWEYEKCRKHSIFLAQAGYPVKGFHQFLKALPMVMASFPDVQVRVAGVDITRRPASLKGMLAYTGYGNFLRKYMKRNNLASHVTFTGPLNAEGMKQEYLDANVFVCPSSIENSPNSLGEAQALGTPCICSFTGGCTDMIPSPECGELYRFEEVGMLAYKICGVFERSSSSDNSQMQSMARDRHDPVRNADALAAIYGEIVNGRE